MRREQSNSGASLSFLDIIACAFGAIVLLVLILPVGDTSGPEPADADFQEYGALLVSQSRLDALVLSLTDDITQADKKIGALDALLESQRLTADSLQAMVQTTQQQVRGARKQAADVEKAAIGTKEAANLSPKEPEVASPEASEYAGLPVDSEYIAIVVDTSGSMQTIWSSVSREIKNLLAIYPQIKGFQILNADGTYMRSPARWVADTKTNRRLTMVKLRFWSPFSPSNPERGIKMALRQLYKPGIKMAIVVFGDDYHGTDYENFLAAVRGSVARHAGQGGELRIHAFGFRNPDVSMEQQTKYAILMRALTQQQRGAFLTIP